MPPPPERPDRRRGDLSRGDLSRGDLSRGDLSRRDLLRASAALCAAGGLAGLSSPARAAAPSDRRFIFVLADGGWDPTRVFQPPFPAAAVEPDARVVFDGELSFIDHPARPSVTAFIESRGGSLAVLNGLMIPSIAHAVCRTLALTGADIAAQADWATRIAVAGAEAYPLPHLVLGGPCFPGAYPLSVARIGEGASLGELLGGEPQIGADLPPPALGAPSQAAIARAVAQETARLSAAGGARAQAFVDAEAALARLGRLESIGPPIASPELPGAWGSAVAALSLGLSRCVSLRWPAEGPMPWDTHGANDDGQSELFEDLFTKLGELMVALSATPGRSAATLADETVVVVYSEMGRTPWLNTVAGKDHWPYTSAMILGPGVRGGQVFGGVNGEGIGVGVDRVTGHASDAAPKLSISAMGATLLTLAGLEDAEDQAGDTPLSAAISD